MLCYDSEREREILFSSKLNDDLTCHNTSTFWVPAVHRPIISAISHVSQVHGTCLMGTLGTSIRMRKKYFQYFDFSFRFISLYRFIAIKNKFVIIK